MSAWSCRGGAGLVAAWCASGFTKPSECDMTVYLIAVMSAMFLRVGDLGAVYA